MKSLCMGTVTEIGEIKECGVHLSGDPNEIDPMQISHGLCEYCQAVYREQISQLSATKSIDDLREQIRDEMRKGNHDTN